MTAFVNKDMVAATVKNFAGCAAKNTGRFDGTYAENGNPF